MSARGPGIPRWLIAGVFVAVLLCVFALPGKKKVEPGPSDWAVRIADGLRDTSVYEQPGAPGKVNAARARLVVGDRPIVVVILREDTQLPPVSGSRSIVGPRQEFCADIAKATPTNIVILFAAEKGSYGSAFCTGKQFSNPNNPVKSSNYDFGLITKAELAWKYRVTDNDMTAKIEEYVLAFDVQAAADYPKGGVPRRAVNQPPPASATPLQAWQIGLAIAGIVAAVLTVFFLLTRLGGWLRGRAVASRHRDLLRAQLGARLNKLADRVIRDGDPADAPRQAELARQYVLLLKDFSDGTGTPDDLDERIDELEEAVR